MLYARTRSRRPVWDWIQQTDSVVNVWCAPEGALDPYPLKPLDAYTSLGGGLRHSLSISPTYYVLALSSAPFSQIDIRLSAGSPAASYRSSSCATCCRSPFLIDRGQGHPGHVSSSRTGVPRSGALTLKLGSGTAGFLPSPASRRL